MDPSAVHGVTRFSDLTPREFRQSVLGLRGVGLPKDANAAPILPTDNLPEDFDWREKGAVTAVKNQVLFLIVIMIIICLLLLFRLKKKSNFDCVGFVIIN